MLDTATHDLRWQRSRARLHAAVIELACTRPAASITGAALAEAAGVHRSTVYQHGTDPVDVLRSALRAELDEIRHTVLEPADASTIMAAMSRSADEVFDHIERHATIYACELADGTSGLSAMLAEHFVRSSMVLIDHGALVLPDVDDNPECFAETAAAAVAASTVAVIEVWLREPAPRDRGVLAKRWNALLPPWWPRLS